MSSFPNVRIGVDSFASSFISQPQEIINGNRRGSGYSVDTSMPPPNFAPSVLMQSEPVLPITFSNPAGLHTPILNYNASHLPVSSPDILQSSFPSSTPRYDSESSQSPSVWINNTIPNIYLENNGTQNIPNHVFPASSPVQNNGIVTMVLQNQSLRQPEIKSPEPRIPIWNNQFAGNNGQSTLNSFSNQMLVNGLPSSTVQFEHTSLPPQNVPPVWNANVPVNQTNVNNQTSFNETSAFGSHIRLSCESDNVNFHLPNVNNQMSYGTSSVDSHAGVTSGSANVPLQVSPSPQFAINSSGNQPPIWNFNNTNFSNNSSQNSYNKFNYGSQNQSNQFNNRSKSNYSTNGQLNNSAFNDHTRKSNSDSSHFHGRNVFKGEHLNSPRKSQSNDLVPNRGFKTGNESFQTRDQNSFNYRNFKNTNNFNVRTNNQERQKNENNSNFKSFKKGVPNNRQNNPRHFPQKYNQNLTDVQIISDSENENSMPKNSFRKEVCSREIRNSNVSDDKLSESDSSNVSRNWHKDENQTSRNKSWMTDSIKNSLQERNKLFQQAKETNDPALWKQYNELKEKINRDIAESKSKPFFNVKKSRHNVNNKFQKKEKNLPFSCDTCDRGYATETELKEHNDLHIKCHYAGCSFEAHPKIVALHKRMQHDTGYAEVINKLESAEDIEKWREERRKRFPTAENILKRKAEQAEKEARGELVEEQDFGKFKRQKFERKTWEEKRFERRGWNRNPRNRRKVRFPYPRSFEYDSKPSEQSESEEECHIKLPKFLGMRTKTENTTDSENDDIADGAKDTLILKDVSQETNEVEILTSPILQDTNDSDEECPVEIPVSRMPLDESNDDEHPDEMPILKAPLNESNGIENKSSDLEATEENDENSSEKQSQTPLHDTTNEAEESTSNKQDNKDTDSSRKRRSDRDRSSKKFRDSEREPAPRKVSLLEMLLDNEICHERNVIMQCVRHIVRNKFFGIGSEVKNVD